MRKKSKKKVAIYLDWPHEFIYEIGKPSRLINSLLNKEFGTAISNDPEENDKIKIEKTLKARRIVLNLKCDH